MGLTNRKELLHRLLCVEPGVSKKESLQQSSCIVLRRGRFYSLSQEVACSIISGLPVEYDGAVRAEKLIDLLKGMPDDEVTVELAEGALTIKGNTTHKRKAKIPMEDEVTLAVDLVERPKEWVKIHEDLPEAIDLVPRCAKKKDEFLKQCVHFGPTFLEASDDIRMIRYPVKTFVQKSVLVRASSIRVVAQLGMTRGCETQNWLHFHNPLGLRLSVKKFGLESYPPLEEFLNLRGRKIVFPKGLGDAAHLAGLFSEEETGVYIVVSRSKPLVIESRNVEGEYSEEWPVEYGGPDLSFAIAPKLIADLLARNNTCEITDCSIRVNSGKYIYVASLEASRNGQDSLL